MELRTVTDRVGTRSALWPLVMVVAALGLVILAAGWMGPLSAQPTFDVRPAPVDPASAGRTATPAAGEGTSASAVLGDSPLVVLLSVVLLLAIGVLALALFLRRLRGAGPGSSRTGSNPGLAMGRRRGHVAGRLGVGLRLAQEELAADSPPRDAIIRCWLALEDGAAAAGLRRPPAATSTEFTTALLTDFDADPVEVHLLRGLYQRARYGVSAAQRSVSPAELAAASAALRSIATSLDRPRP